MCHTRLVSSSAMSRLQPALLLVFLLLIHESRQEPQPPTIVPMSYGCVVNISLPDTKDEEAFVRQLSIGPAADLMFNITHIPTTAAFLIFQTHVYEYNVTLSYDKANLDKASGKSVFGSNIGLFVDARSNTPKIIYLRNENVRSVDALLIITVYGNGAPIPGGCNMEFETEVAPYMKLNAGNDLITIDMQPASLPVLTYPKFTCDRTAIKHTVYQMFLPEHDFSADSYFSAIRSMLTVKNIEKNGRKMSPGWRTPMRRVHSAYVGVGSVYVAVSKYKNYSSAFVPTFSYACSPLLYPESCQMLNGIMPKLVCAFAFFFGIFTLFFPSRSNILNKSMPVFIIGCMIGYTLAKGSSMSVEISLVLAVSTGILLIAVQYWMTFIFTPESLNTNNHSMVLPVAAGLFLASAMYSHLPDILLFSNDFAFWTIFFLITFFFCCLTAFLNFIGVALSSSLFGSGLIVLSIDYYTPSCLKYIFINIIRRATVTDFDLATVHPPTQAADIWMTILWCFLALYGLAKLAGIDRDTISSRLTVRTPLTVRIVNNRVPSAPQYATFQ